MSEQKKSFPVLLALSLCVNAMLIGGVAAGLYSLKADKAYERREHHDKGHHDKGGPGGGPFEERLARSAFDTLSWQEKRAFREGLAREWRTTKSDRETVDKARADLRQALSGEEIDRDAAAAAFLKIRGAETKMRERLQTRLLDLMEQLPAEKRQKLIEKSAQRMEDFKDRKGPPPMPPGGFGDRPLPPERD